MKDQKFSWTTVSTHDDYASAAEKVNKAKSKDGPMKVKKRVKRKHAPRTRGGYGAIESVTYEVRQGTPYVEKKADVSKLGKPEVSASLARELDELFEEE